MPRAGFLALAWAAESARGFRPGARVAAGAALGGPGLVASWGRGVREAILLGERV